MGWLPSSLKWVSFEHDFTMDRGIALGRLQQDEFGAWNQKTYQIKITNLTKRVEEEEEETKEKKKMKKRPDQEGMKPSSRREMWLPSSPLHKTATAKTSKWIRPCLHIKGGVGPTLNPTQGWDPAPYLLVYGDRGLDGHLNPLINTDKFSLSKSSCKDRMVQSIRIDAKPMDP